MLFLAEYQVQCWSLHHLVATLRLAVQKYGWLSPPVARQGVNCGLTQEDRLELEPIYTIRFMINQE